MYSYTWDIETGGLLLNSSPLHFSKEPRPVYSKELDILGFDKYWEYDKDNSTPLMWAEANNYIYRGKHVASIKGGSFLLAPTIQLVEPLIEDKLKPVDIPSMVEKNREILDALTQQTIKSVYNTYMKFKSKVDVFHVSYSGGKDSEVTLDIVQKALPHNAFVVIFGDTGMEFDDTYKFLEIARHRCEQQSIRFYIAKSHLSPIESWKLIGPPAKRLRWCCSVHKTAPQLLKLKEILGMSSITEMSFVGVRADESLRRSGYEYISYGMKHKGQYSCYPILEWNTAEVYLYMYAENLQINEAYKMGHRRVGCLLCPHASESNEYYRHLYYPEKFNAFVDVIKNSYREHIPLEEELNKYVVNGDWKARTNGNYLVQKCSYDEFNDNKSIKLTISSTCTNWKQWIKTIGVLQNDSSPYLINFRGSNYLFREEAEGNTMTITIDANLAKTAPSFVKLLKQVFRKSATCIGCRVCEADCPHGAIQFIKGQVFINDTCHHCAMCHKVDNGCLVYSSLLKSKGLNMKNFKSIDCYGSHGPRMDWFVQFFKYKEHFAEMNTLGSMMFEKFKRFLKDAGLIDKNILTKTALTLDSLGLNERSSWALMLANLVYTPQFNWFVTHFNFNEIYKKDYVSFEIINTGAKERQVQYIWTTIARFCDLPFSKVGYAEIIREGGRAVAFIRYPWGEPDPRVILYSLYRYAETCGDYYQFSLSTLYDDSVDSDGVSPRHIFGISKADLKAILIGLSSNYNEYVSATFTHDLDNISLNKKFLAQDILKLF